MPNTTTTPTAASTTAATDSNPLEETLKALPQLLREREAQLEERERQVKRLKTSLEQAHPAPSSDVLRLNVGGHRLDVLRRTLTQVEGSLLESKFSGRWTMETDADGCLFVDQSAELFVPLIDSLRARQIETPLAKPTAPPELESDKQMDDFHRMVEYYGVSLAVYPVGIYRLYTRTSEWKLVGQGECRLEATNWATYALKPYEGVHARNVESYEITLEEQCSSVQIGWISLFNLHKFNQSENGRGVGYGSTSVALDCVRSGIVEAGNLLELPLEVDLVQTGTTIRSQRFGSDWYVNGVLVASTSEEKPNVLKLGSPYLDTVPCISIKGTCRISKIELTF